MRFRLFVAAMFAALLAGCAVEAPYYGGPYYNSYGYAYDYDYYGPTYYGPAYDGSTYYGPSYYAPGYLAFSYRSGDGYRDHWSGTGTWHGSATTGSTWQRSAQAPTRSTTRSVAQPRVRSSTTVAHAERRTNREAGVDRAERAARHPSHIAAQRTGPDREHGG